MEKKDTSRTGFVPKHMMFCSRDVFLSMQQMMAQTGVRFYPFYLTNEIPTDNNESNFSKYKCDTVFKQTPLFRTYK